MAANKIFRKFPIGSLISYDPDDFWWDFSNPDEDVKSLGLVIHADQIHLYILLNGSIIEVNKKSLFKIRVVQRPSKKCV